MAYKSPNALDEFVGARIRLQRTLLGLSQEELGTMLSIPLPEIQAYEKGVHRIGAGRLQVIADALKVPVSVFFDGVVGTPSPKRSLDEYHDFLSDPEGIQLADAFLKIKNPTMRRAIIDMARAAAED